MKPAHERSQECLPPKKRDLAQTALHIEEPPKVDTSASSESPANEAPPSTWPRGGGGGVVVATSGQGPGVSYDVAGEGAEAVTVDQYGNLYKVALPPNAFSPSGLHPVVNMASVPPSFNVASPLIQHPGLSYPPIHYTPISHTSVQYLASHYGLSYAMPPGFLQRAVISPPVTLAASHYVPYNSIMADGGTPPPQTPSPHSYSKVNSAQSPPLVMGVVPIDVTKGRVPVYYQPTSQLPPGYPVHEMVLACPPTSEQSAPSPSHKESLITPSNGTQRGPDSTLVRRGSQAMDQYIHDTGANLARAKGEGLMDCDAYSGHAPQRTEVALMTHRSTPDTDLEVQRVVGGMASQEFCPPAVQRKDRISPINLSNHAKHEAKLGSRNLTSPSRGTLRGASNSQLPIKYTERNALIANGDSAQAARCPESLPAEVPQHASKTQRTKSPDSHRGDPHSDKGCPPTGAAQPPHSSALPSHFMKGAIIQLATGELKRVEDLQTQDFVRSAEVSGGLKIDSSTVVDIQESQWPGFVTLHFVVGEQQSKVCLDVPPEHPFFVYGQGWSSCNPSQTTQLFALPCHRLQVGDVCISISLQNLAKNGASQGGGLPAHQGLPLPYEKSVLQSRECPERDCGEQKGHPVDGGAPSAHAPQLPMCPLPTAQSSWPSPALQRYPGQGSESRPSPSRHSFIPQEVKLSIEGRSNAGK